jgi:hypothetical protein
MTFMRITIGLGAALASSTCGGGGMEPPRAGVVLVRIEGAVPGDEAVLLDIAAGATTVTRARDDVEIHARASQPGGPQRVAILGPIAGAELLRVTVNNPQTPPSITIRDVAASDGTLRGDLAGYTVRVDPAP